MSVFLDLDPSDWVGSNELAFAIRDSFPVSPGHTLVVPRRLINEWWEATPTERLAIFELVDDIKRRLDAEYAPDGYNVGFNAGAAAGQTVGHLHLHVIPRFDGDVPDPRGGVRHVIPERGNYLEPSRPRHGQLPR
jgi:diadenosine tetraphosphate (Ap4A) HIT family hydrolase